MTMGDTYPGDQAYWSEVKRIRQSVNDDEIRLGKRTEGFSREFDKGDLAKVLAEAHNTRSVQNKEPNATWSGASITEREVEQGLEPPTRSYDQTDWEAWMGFHGGHWYTRVKPHPGGVAMGFHKDQDDAGWCPPGTTQRSEFSDPDDHQSVQFFTRSEEVKRVGWNESNAAADFVWGWDPKDEDPSSFGGGPGSLGTHVGFPFSTDEARWIVWVTPQVAFLECITSAFLEKHRRRTSVPSWDWGYGQWKVKNVVPGLLNGYP